VSINRKFDKKSVSYKKREDFEEMNFKEGEKGEEIR
jgi:hypothetical protein